jgi:GNAT superfamily N-acetyltransferase
MNARPAEHISYSFATAGDIPALIACRIRCLRDSFCQANAGSESLLKRHFAESLHRNLPSGTYTCAPAKVDNVIVALGALVIREYPGSFQNPGSRNGYVLNMYTMPEFRKRGIGGKILALLIEAGHAAGIGMFELHATPMGGPVHLQAGFRRHNEPTYRMYVNSDS